ncbi:hypothetical protein H6P81_011727 [Aristolochia fimbriata]|uniref:Uncharacterized protein n=1 Tax=Aristolochia fimbriata TaxID=158543 RepID=A0AAV7EBH4_ARIFI|nr:hypothetical protein H6P81_011727 [Aristolochia fimbriata]
MAKSRQEGMCKYTRRIRFWKNSIMRRPVFLGLLLVLFLGVAVYIRLWAIDLTISEAETEIIRRQFDLANKEAMEESAEWRLKYDEEVERGTQRLRELIQAKQALEKKTLEAASLNKSLTILQKENINLLERVESMTQELENEKLKCSTRE